MVAALWRGRKQSTCRGLASRGEEEKDCAGVLGLLQHAPRSQDSGEGQHASRTGASPAPVGPNACRHLGKAVPERDHEQSAVAPEHVSSQRAACVAPEADDAELSPVGVRVDGCRVEVVDLEFPVAQVRDRSSHSGQVDSNAAARIEAIRQRIRQRELSAIAGALSKGATK